MTSAPQTAVKTHTSHDLFEQRYLQERKKTRNLAILTIVLAVLLVGVSGYSYAALKKAATQRPRFAQAGFNPAQGNPSGPGGLRGLSMKNFINSDGSVNTDKVKQLINNAPPQFKDRLLGRVGSQITAAQQSGEITQSQADALRQAFGVTSSSVTTSPNPGGTNDNI